MSEFRRPLTSDDRVYLDIEAKADLHEPSVYGLLSFYHSLSLQPEAYSGFVPLTTAQWLRPDETKIFAVGLIPPAIPVSARKLDRSASLEARYGAYTEVSEVANETTEAIASVPDVEEVQGNAINDPLFVSMGPNNSLVAPKPQVAQRSAKLIATLHPSIQVLANKLIALAAQRGISIVICQGERTIEYQDKLYAKGRTAPGGIVTNTKGGQSWHNYGLAFDIAMVSSGPKPALGQPSWPPGKERWAELGALGQSLGLIWGGTFSKIADYGHFEYHPGITKAQALQGARPPIPDEPAPLVDSALPATGWSGDGAPAAQQAARLGAKLSNKDLNTTELGKSLQASQESTIRLMQSAVDQIANTPPLRMLVNPSSFKVSSEKLIASGSRGRYGSIIEQWGDQQDKIEGSGKIAAFYSIDASKKTGPGLTRNARQFSASYQNLLSLFLIYKNNGGVWMLDPLVSANIKNLTVVGSVYLYYDNILYIGSFDSLSLDESDDGPFTLDYSFSFTVRAWFLLDRLDDRRYTYRGGLSSTTIATTGTPGSPLQSGHNPQPSADVTLPRGSAPDDPLFGLNDGDIGSDLEGI